MLSDSRRSAAVRAARWRLLGAAGLALGLLLVGCQGMRTVTAPGLADGPALAAADRLSIVSGSLPSSTGCALDYRLYRRSGAVAPVQVVLAHGFLRSKERMAGLASALADAGLVTLALDLCNMRPWNGAHRQNAADMQRIAAHLGAPQVLYAGFSAGGLAALLAAHADPHSVGALVMDLVDQDRLGQQAAVALRRPIVGLVGEPSRCNANNNGLPALSAATDARVIRFDGASHCDFESPSDTWCRLICETGARDAQTSAQTRASIIDASVGAARRLVLRPGADG